MVMSSIPTLGWFAFEAWAISFSTVCLGKLKASSVYNIVYQVVVVHIYYYDYNPV